MTIKRPRDLLSLLGCIMSFILLRPQHMVVILLTSMPHQESVNNKLLVGVHWSAFISQIVRCLRQSGHTMCSPRSTNATLDTKGT